MRTGSSLIGKRRMPSPKSPRYLGCHLRRELAQLWDTAGPVKVRREIRVAEAEPR